MPPPTDHRISANHVLPPRHPPPPPHRHRSRRPRTLRLSAGRARTDSAAARALAERRHDRSVGDHHVAAEQPGQRGRGCSSRPAGAAEERLDLSRRRVPARQGTQLRRPDGRVRAVRSLPRARCPGPPSRLSQDRYRGLCDRPRRRDLGADGRRRDADEGGRRSDPARHQSRVVESQRKACTGGFHPDLRGALEAVAIPLRLAFESGQWRRCNHSPRVERPGLNQVESLSWCRIS